MNYHAENPDDLIKDMAGLLKVCGITTSFLDKDEIIRRGEYVNPWKILARVLLNPLSIENQIFIQNLEPILEEANAYRELKERIELK